MNQVYSTREMAQMCGVNESTIKRWADSGKLRCMKTPGGHRKFKIKDVLAFFSEYGFEALGVSHGVAGDVEPGEAYPMLVLKHDLPGLARYYLESATSKEPRDAAKDLFGLLTAGFSLSEICDGVIGPAMEEVGNRWADGRMSVLQEHLVTATTIHALNRMAEMVPRQVASGRTALCCPADRETHSIGVEMTRLMLESLGWSTRVAVSPTPFDEVAEFLRAEKPDLICVSIVQTGNGALRDRLHEVHAVARETGTLLALGGRGIQNRDDLPNDFMGRTLKELENFARNLVTRRRGVGVEDRINGRQQA